MIPKARLLDNSPKGAWQVWVYPFGERLSVSAVNATFVRDAPTLVESLSTVDPFGPGTATLKFPAVTMLDRLGSDDLWWLLPEADVDIVWVNADGDPVYRWEGYLVSFDFAANAAGGELSVTCQGALYQMDNYLAFPEYVYQALPYERAIARQFENRTDSRLAGFRTEFPSWWTTRYVAADYADGPAYLAPSGLEDGAPWSGLVTRTTGNFDTVLTSYVQGLLGSMHTDTGQFTLTLDQGRVPVLRHRDRKTSPDAATLEVNVLWPGVEIGGLSRDFSQRLNVVYGQGKALTGQTYSGMKVSADGSRTFYEPLAARRSVHPQVNNPWYTRATMRKEVNLSIYEGISQDEARIVARRHLERFSDPGVTGSLTLKVDPLLDGSVFPRELITAGQAIVIRGLFGQSEGHLFHITEASVTPDATSLTLDSKFRDQLTVQEVQVRGRDSLSPVRMITVGQFSPLVPDQLFPWSYEMGAGFIPKGSNALFRGMPSTIAFPWESWVRQRPPGDPQWADNYIRIGPASYNADENWANQLPGTGAFKPYAIRMSQAGEARMLQIAAYDSEGNLLQVPFHVSLYKTNGVTVQSMPMMAEEDEDPSIPYTSGQHYPFFRNAWERVRDNGQVINPETTQAVATAEIIVGYGTFFEKGGYWPGSSSMEGALPTGMLVDEQGFSWDLTNTDVNVNPQEPPETNLLYPERADIYIMVYCDAQAFQDVYFVGRIFRREPGTA